MVAFARRYGVTIHTCRPCDPASKGGSESSVKIAKADLVPRDTNLLEAYDSFADLEAACEAFCEGVNTRSTGPAAAPTTRCSPPNSPGCTRSLPTHR